MGLVVAGSSACFADEGTPDDVKASVVKLTVTQRGPDFNRPWNKANPAEVSGTGFVIEGNRIVTNAHVVRYASQIYVQPHQSDEKFEASVIGISYGLDLALLKLSDDTAIEKIKPLSIDDQITPLRSEVNVYGFPIGGDQISITKGIVSRIEYTNIGGSQYGLRAQVDAAINPGNSGGPAIGAGKVVGVAFSGIANASNIGYLIQSTELIRFLKDVEDGKYDGKPNLWLSYQSVENPALRAKLKLPKSSGGVLITSIPERDRHESFPLREGDVITKIGPNAIDSQGNVKVNELTLGFLYYVPIVAEDNKVKLTVWRDSQELEIECPASNWLRNVMPILDGEYPRYFILGPLTFEMATLEFATAAQADKRWSTFLASRSSPLIHRMQSQPEFEGEELVVIPTVPFSHRVTKGYPPTILHTIQSVNKTKIKNLKHLVEVFRDCTDEFIEIEFHEIGSPLLVFNRQELMTSTEDILSDNNIRKQFSDDLTEAWSNGKSK
jgi:S1-C subfamily serine protease